MLNVVQESFSKNLKRRSIAAVAALLMATSNGNVNVDASNEISTFMDLWNNHWGRVDGIGANNNQIRHQRFVERWYRTGNTGLARGRGTAATSMPLSRQRHLWDNRWHRPLG